MCFRVWDELVVALVVVEFVFAEVEDGVPCLRRVPDELGVSLEHVLEAVFKDA